MPKNKYFDRKLGYPDDQGTLTGVNGWFEINLGWPSLWSKADVVGSPYRLRPVNSRSLGVCLTETLRSPADIHLPIEDFSVPRPEDEDAVHMALQTALEALVWGQPVWAGCQGGFGRTGLFIALLVKAARISDDPVTYVREHYYPRAVETPEQKAYVDDFDVSGYRWLIFKMRVGKMIGARIL